MIERYADSSDLPLSSVVRVGNLVFASGHVGYTGPGAPITTEIADALHNLEVSLDRAGARRDQVLKTTVFLNSLDDTATANTVYGEFFADHLPARTTICVQLVPPYRYEIEAVAHIED